MRLPVLPRGEAKTRELSYFLTALFFLFLTICFRTYNCANNQFSVRYYLKLELAETSGRKFSKKIEIFLQRKPEAQSRLP
mmetsp:Transcript_18176/g.72782  ORF Transcript_18176/g.72782 Transcript_18176/m.72782 type:complete len:80 (-) Transcript_18176:1212-1451(-)